MDKSTTDSLQNLAAGLGTDRDKRSHNVYGPVTALDQVALSSAYRSSWLAKRIINSVAEDMTREWLTVSFDDIKPENRLAIERAERRLALKSKFTEAIKWARLYGGAGIVLGVGTADLAVPLDASKVKKGDLKFAQVLDRHRLHPADSLLVKDPASPHFGKPEFYRIADSQQRVHCSRVLRFEGQQLPYLEWVNNGYWGDSELQHLMDALKDKDATSAGIAAMVFEANVDVIKVTDLTALVAAKGGTEKLLKRFQVAATMKSYNRTLIISGEEDYEKKSNNFSNLDKINEGFMMDVCGAACIPATRLFGRSPGGMNSTGDGEMTDYYDTISSKQETDMMPQAEWLYEIIARSELGYLPDDLTIEFNALWQVPAKERAEIDKLRAERDAIYLTNGVVTEGVIARTLKEDGTYSGLTDEDVTLAEELAEQVDEPEQEEAPPLPGQEDPAEELAEAPTDV